MTYMFVLFAEFPNGHKFAIMEVLPEHKEYIYSQADSHARKCGLPETAVRFRVYSGGRLCYEGTIAEKLKSTLI